MTGAGARGCWRRRRRLGWSLRRATAAAGGGLQAETWRRRAAAGVARRRCKRRGRRPAGDGRQWRGSELRGELLRASLRGAASGDGRQQRRRVLQIARQVGLATGSGCWRRGLGQREARQQWRRSGGLLVVAQKRGLGAAVAGSSDGGCSGRAARGSATGSFFFLSILVFFFFFFFSLSLSLSLYPYD